MKTKILLVTPTHLNEKYKVIVDNFRHEPVQFIQVVDDRESILKNIKQAQVMIGCPRHFFDEQLLDKAEQLQWVHNLGAGIEEFCNDYFIRLPVVFTNGRIIQGPECADHAISLLLALTRNIVRTLKAQDPKKVRPIELHGKKMTIIGGGGIGLLIAQRAKAFGMTVTLVDIDYKPMLADIDEFYKFEDMGVALKHTDVVVISAPLTSMTFNLFTKQRLMAIKKGAYFINISRGEIVNTDDLLECVKSGHFSGVGLDVTNPEPLPTEHGLYNAENVIITPHIAGLSDNNHNRAIQLVINNIRRFINGMPLINVVNKEYGY